MFYEEKVIDGVLCWRSSPDGEWVKKTPEQLTDALVALRKDMRDVARGDVFIHY